jgi:chromate transporter
MALAWSYVRFGSLPQVGGILYAVKPVIIAVVVQAVWRLAKPAMRTPFLALSGAAAFLLAILGADELLLLFGIGAVSGIVQWRTSHQSGDAPIPMRSVLLMLAIATIMVLLPSTLTWIGADSVGDAVPVGRTPIFLFFVKVGSVLYGSGYVLLAFLRSGLVDQWHWLTEAQLLDAVAIGQVTPGPVFTTATFIGYLLEGTPGAVIATIGIFLPSFLFSALSGPLVPRLRRSRLAGAFLDGVNVAALALMAAVLWQLGSTALVDTLTIAISLASVLLLVYVRINSVWLIASAALLGLLLSLSGLR